MTRLLMLAALANLSGTTLLAQSASAPSLKAAFLFNFAKFAEWPQETLVGGVPLTLCVFGDDEVTGALSEIVKGRPADNATMAVRRVFDESSLRSCHLLYVSGIDTRRAIGTLDRVKGLPVLTVSDVNGFAAAGGVAEFFEENGKMRFAINTRASDRGRLRLSSRLLSLAKIVREESHVVQR